jgi:hypothetical protein
MTAEQQPTNNTCFYVHKSTNTHKLLRSSSILDPVIVHRASDLFRDMGNEGTAAIDELKQTIATAIHYQGDSAEIRLGHVSDGFRVLMPDKTPADAEQLNGNGRTMFLPLSDSRIYTITGDEECELVLGNINEFIENFELFMTRPEYS